MDLVKLEQKLIETARSNPPSERVPYAFEKRVMARIRERLAEDPWATWARALWRAAAPCVAVTVLLTAWSLADPATGSPPPSAGAADFSQELEKTVLAAAVQESFTDSGW